VALKNIPDPGFRDDDGSADPRLAAALAAYAGDRAVEPEVLAALPGARLLVPVLALPGETEHREDGLLREKSSDMAVPTLQAPDGRRALPAFSSVESLARWRADARPVAVRLPQALRAAAQENAGTVLIDVAGPVTYALTGPALHALAAGRDRLDPLTDPSVVDAVRQAITAEQQIVRAHLVASPGADTDGRLCLVLARAADVAATAQRVAAALAADETLRARLVRGLDLALLPLDTPVPGDALVSRA
jgi:hypothetical protein